MYLLQIKMEIGMRHFLILITAFIFVATAKAQNIYVIAAGVNDYADPSVNDLRCCENDVEDFCSLMTKQKVFMYKHTGRQATKTAILNALTTICQNATEKDFILFFFSGHGYPNGFCPYDMTNYNNGLSYAEMQNVFKQSRAGKKIVFADACFSGGLRKKKSNIPNINKDGDVIFFLSSRTNEKSQEAGKNGQFTRFLIRGLGGGADVNRDRIITAKEIYDFVHKGVVIATYDKQHPVMWGKFDNDMPILTWTHR